MSDADADVEVRHEVREALATVSKAVEGLLSAAPAGQPCCAKGCTHVVTLAAAMATLTDVVTSMLNEMERP